MTCVLLVGGTDSSGGAGLSRDVSFATRLGCFAKPVVTCVTAQTNSAVQKVHQVPTDVVAAQIETALNDQRPGAIKIGMVGSRTMADTIADALKSFTGPIVLDPVMVAKSGDPLLSEDAIAALIRDLLPRAAILTPNLPEAARLLGRAPASSPDEAEAQGRALLSMGPDAVLMKGGHGAGAVCTDLLVGKDGTTRLEAARIDTRNTHGTGCSLSSAIAAELAKGRDLTDAVRHAHLWLHEAIAHADRLDIGSGHGPVHHFHEVWS